MPLPARSVISDFDADNKINYATIPPANQQTDWDNTKLAPGISDVVALGLTGCRFWCRITLAASTGALVLNSWYANWQNVTTTLPVLAHTNTGAFTITLPTYVSDEYDASIGTTNNIVVNLGAAQASFEGSTFGFANASASGNVITIQTANAGGSGNDMIGVVLMVSAR